MALIVVRSRCLPSRPIQSNRSQARIQNRIEALFQEERSQVQSWAEQDLKNAREAAWKILPLLRLGAGGDSSVRRLQILDTTTVATNHGQGERSGDARVLRPFHVLDDSAARDEEEAATIQERASRTSSLVLGLSRSFGRGSVAAAAAENNPKDDQPAGDRQGAAAWTATRREVEPVPLRARGSRAAASERAGALVPSRRRYRGEGFLEPRGSRVGLYSHAAFATTTPGGEIRPAPLAQQVLRLRDGGEAGRGAIGSAEGVVAVVRVVLEPPPPPARGCDCDCGPHPENDGTEGGPNRGRATMDHEGGCEVRGVLRVEAYLPSSSTTLTLRVKVPSAAAAAAAAAIPASSRGESGAAAAAVAAAENGSSAVAETEAEVADAGLPPHRAAGESEGRRPGSDGQLLLPLASDGAGGHVAAECRSRKQRRRALREARDAEARRGDEEISAAIREAAAACVSRSGPVLPQRQPGGAVNAMVAAAAAGGSQRPGRPDGRAGGGDGPPRLKQAFSMLLVRANAVVPIRPLNLASGSWREAIGELVGSPPGQELRRVSGGGCSCAVMRPRERCGSREYFYHPRATISRSRKTFQGTGGNTVLDTGRMISVVLS